MVVVVISGYGGGDGGDIHEFSGCGGGVDVC